MTGELSVFCSSITPFSQTMCLTDGSTTQIRSKGIVHLSAHITLSSILHVLNFVINLLLVSHLTKILNCAIIYLPTVVFYRTGLQKRFFARDMRVTDCITLRILHGRVGCLLVFRHLFCLTLNYLCFHLELYHLGYVNF